MAKRFCGTLELTISYVDSSESYTVRIRELNDDARFETLKELRLSPHMQARTAVDSREAYDAVARAAISFASYDDETIYQFAAIDSDSGEATVRRKALD